MTQQTFQHLHITPQTHQLVHFRGCDYYMVPYGSNYKVGDFILVSEFDSTGVCLHSFTEQILEIDINKSKTKMMLIMKPWSAAEEIFSKLKKMRLQEEFDEKNKEREFLHLTQSFAI
ncbi:hypothetical protein SAMN02745116_01304 [Pilibacter termitis]|uniref:Uncharacterized protein n=1 Tax=Pilibacter termitis TaxID=263852 RepID=A0A1T4N4V2_9ENTE|nr:hypothetical protein [Pilibacter termitis]SJZ74184.1 hypothetical protein SAMN02745116_01304 [Pilibacter termitis]